MKTMDLNCDMGESFGAYKLGMDEKVMQYIASANIACGFHAGDPLVMDRTVKMAVEKSVGIGAHPGYPDLLGFGRRSMALTPEEIRQYLVYQMGALKAFCNVHSATLQHVKPHGALYLDAVEDEAIARAVAESIMSLDPDLYFIALAGKKGKTMRQVGEELGLKVVFEAFPDRAYTPEGTLVSRKKPGAVISNPDLVAKRALDMASGFVKAVDGTIIELEVQTLCVHGDNLAAVDLVKTIKKTLEENNIRVKPMGEKIQ
ncbi:MAG: 5-oxoprolinase subunit PxpA [Deltaproteobacteria bacterium]|nr:5-oxoprolinase subunit PxpA [Deltaproteobacteria bacterium]